MEEFAVKTSSYTNQEQMYNKIKVLKLYKLSTKLCIYKKIKKRM